ncbi:tyrosine-type recombinase/integrase [Sphaerisporangium aureirubrum]|uniref:Core-binding (CB) domain-containing protein n=1 Tax=Sphaerisporangium aureirubrum TaxID=1544736 RepID=A0ABW1NGM3_9ACTN
MADNTRRSYESHIRLYLIPHLGRIPIDQLTVTHFTDLFDAIEETNDIIRQARTSADPALRATIKGRRVVGPTSLHRIRATARHALNIAIKQDRLIDFNPAAVVELPPASKPRPLVWTPNASTTGPPSTPTTRPKPADAPPGTGPVSSTSTSPPHAPAR